MLEKKVETAWLDSDALHELLEEAFASCSLEGKRVLCIVPDSTRSMPMPEMYRALYAGLKERAEAFDFLIALGTHPPMDDGAIGEWFDVTRGEREDRFGDARILNHDWQNPDALVSLGSLSKEKIVELSDGRLESSVEVLANKMLLDYDVLCVVGPVFPHEVAGFSGGNKYFFPGVAGPDVLHLFHWLGALITNPETIGRKHTPVRAVIDAASSMIPKEKIAFCLNVIEGQCREIYFGSPEEAWDKAADAAARTHIVQVDHAYDCVLAMCPERYGELWVAGKCMYKLENIVADGGELIIFGPHVDRISETHGEILRRIGYHTRDYFLAQMEKFADVPGGILAHSSHVRGIGEYVDGVERPRIAVTLATGISEEDCLAVNLGYRDPASIQLGDWVNREGTLVVPNAGEVLYRVAGENGR